MDGGGCWVCACICMCVFVCVGKALYMKHTLLYGPGVYH